MIEPGCKPRLSAFKVVLLTLAGRDVPLRQDRRLFEGQECVPEFFVPFLAASTASCMRWSSIDTCSFIYPSLLHPDPEEGSECSRDISYCLGLTTNEHLCVSETVLGREAEKNTATKEVVQVGSGENFACSEGDCGLSAYLTEFIIPAGAPRPPSVSNSKDTDQCKLTPLIVYNVLVPLNQSDVILWFQKVKDSKINDGFSGLLTAKAAEGP